MSFEAFFDPGLVAILCLLAFVFGVMYFVGILCCVLEEVYGVPVLDVYGLYEMRLVVW